MRVDFGSIHKILVIKLRAIGDVLLSTVVVDNLRAAFPKARIDFLTERPSGAVMEGNPAVDALLVFDAKLQSSIGLINRVRRGRYDLVLDLFGNPRSAVVTYLSGSPYRVGYRFKWRQYCYNIIVEPRGGEVHNTDFNLDVLRAIDVPIVSTDIRFPLDGDAERFAQEFFAREQLQARFTVALNAGGGWYTKRWRIPQFAELGEALAKEYDARVLITWGPGELDSAKQLQAHMRQPATLLPQTSLKQLGAILKRCSLFVTNDSGPMHIAAAVGTPVVAIFGPTNPELQGPVGEQHVVVRNEQLLCLCCNFTECPIGNPCMLELTVSDVLTGVRQAIEKNHLLTIKHATA